jgi:hypothetical protein
MPAVRTAPIAAALLACLLVAAVASGASADQSYHVTGKDTFAIGDGDVKSEISYAGSESLSRSRRRSGTMFVARARYVRVDQGATSEATAEFSAVISPSGEQRDISDDDPDYLTILNQPFAAQLDAPTLRDLARLRNDVPFEFPSPMTASSLHGRLKRIGMGTVAGARALGVSFEAGGPMRGPLPDHSHLTMNGHIRMSGAAYYRTEDALLLLLDATLTISGNLANADETNPVRIVYRRRIRAEK